MRSGIYLAVDIASQLTFTAAILQSDGLAECRIGLPGLSGAISVSTVQAIPMPFKRLSKNELAVE